MPRPIPVWGFPAGYNPNLMGDVCERCGKGSWLERRLPGKPFTAWTCATCTLLAQHPQQIPDC